MWITFYWPFRSKQNLGMDVERMLEDLEASVWVSPTEPGTIAEWISATRSASVKLGDRTVRLQRLVFCSDFLLGQHQSRTFALSYKALKQAQLFAGGQTPAQVSSLKFGEWIKHLPLGLCASVHVAGLEPPAKAAVRACDGKLLCLATNNPGSLGIVVAIAAIELLEFDVVDNKYPL